MAGHWYNNQGNPQHFDAAGRPTTLRQARKENLYPSSTTINSILDKPQLNKWIKESALKTAFDNIPLEGESIEGYVKRISNLAYKETSTAADYGTRFHAAAENFFNGEPMDEEFRPQLEPIIEWKKSKGISFDEREYSFASPEHGFGGCIDIVASNESGARMIADFKTRKSNPNYKMKPYGQEIVQIGSYATGYYGEQAVLNNEIFGVNIFVSSTEPGRVEIHGYPPEEVNAGWKLFQAISEVWFKVKSYDPRDRSTGLTKGSNSN